MITTLPGSTCAWIEPHVPTRMICLIPVCTSSLATMLSDGAPIPRRDYYAEVARQLGAPPPTFIAPPAGSPAAVRAEANRRVRNDKLRATLGVDLAYPSYCQGLAAILGTTA